MYDFLCKRYGLLLLELLNKVCDLGLLLLVGYSGGA